MKKIKFLLVVIALFSLESSAFFFNKKAKIVGLVQVRNEAPIIEQFLHALAKYTDSIVVLDDASDDDTVHRIESLAKKLSIEVVMKNEKSAWQVSTENENRQKLLDAGRSIGGTHFILIDADEIFSANCMDDNWLKNNIYKLRPGMKLYIPCVNLWGGITHYRNDAWCNPHQRRWMKPVAFCDNGRCSYRNMTHFAGGPANIIHGCRVPQDLSYRLVMRIEGDEHVLMHFKYANLDGIEVKKNWYMCLEFIRAQEKVDDALKNATIINGVYENKEFACLMPKKEDIILVPIKSSWLTYDFLDSAGLVALNKEQKNEVRSWFSHYGDDYFCHLNLNRAAL